MNPANLALTGQATCIAALRRIVQSGDFGHALLFASVDAVALDAVAAWCSERILCTAGGSEPCGTCAGCRSFQRQDGLMLYHATLGDLSTYAVDDIRAIRGHLAVRAGQPGRRVVRIDSIECCTVAAANALLKVLEEPGAEVTFILTAATPARVLPTIRSRAMLYRLQPVPRAAMERLLAEAGISSSAIAKVVTAAPGQVGTAAAIADSAEALGALRSADTVAEAVATQTPVGRFRAIAAYLEGKREPSEQRQLARMLFAAFARRSATDPWVRQRLQRMLSSLRDLQSNSQPKLILEAFVT